MSPPRPEHGPELQARLEITPSGVIQLNEHERRITRQEDAVHSMQSMVLEIFQATTGLPDRLKELTIAVEKHVDASAVRSEGLEEKVRALENDKVGRSAVVNVIWKPFGQPLVKYGIMALLTLGAVAFVTKSNEGAAERAALRAVEAMQLKGGR